MTYFWGVFFFALVIPIVTSLENDVSFYCTQNGYFCAERCSKLIRCTHLGNKTYDLQLIRTCPGIGYLSSLCNAKKLDCSAQYCGGDPNILLLENKCHIDGTYPDPWNCQKYFECKNNVMSQKVCKNSLAYDAKYKNCTESAYKSRPCSEGPIPTCSNLKQTGAYPEDPNVFYVCALREDTYLVPELRKCKQGFSFRSEEATCLPNNAIIPMFSPITCFLSLLAIFMSKNC